MEAEAGMDIEPSRKGLFQGRVLMANSLCLSALGTLEILGGSLLESDGGQQPPCVAAADRKLEEAGMELGLALANMGAARYIAHRGGAAAALSSSAAPLDPVDDDLAGDRDVESALKCIEEAKALAVDAHDRVEAARGHLGAAALLRPLNDEGGGGEGASPWEQSPCLAERLNGVLELREALSATANLVEMTAAASEAAFGSSGGAD